MSIRFTLCQISKTPQSPIDQYHWLHLYLFSIAYIYIYPYPFCFVRFAAKDASLTPCSISESNKSRYTQIQLNIYMNGGRRQYLCGADDTIFSSLRRQSVGGRRCLNPGAWAAPRTKDRNWGFPLNADTIVCVRC